MNRDVLVDIVVPLYNEEAILAKSVRTVVEFLHASSFPYPYRITLANNASTDNSLRVCLDLAKTYPTVHVPDIGEKGKGRAIRRAWQESSGSVLVFMDADLSSDLEYLRPLVDGVIVGGNDLSIGSRLGTNSTIISDKLLRKVASRFYNSVVRTVLGSPFPDHQCGFKAMNKKAFDLVAPELTENGFFFDTELIAVALHHHLKIISIDIVWHDSPQSKVSLMKDSIKMFFDVLRLKKRLGAQRDPALHESATHKKTS